MFLFVCIVCFIQRVCDIYKSFLFWLAQREKKNISKRLGQRTDIYIYIYIYIERER